MASKRPEGKPLAGFWEFPGGKLERGETGEQALVRELWEELALRVISCRWWKTIQNGNIRLHFYNVETFEGYPIPREGQNIAWITPQEALDMNFIPADADVLRRLAQDACR